MTMKKEKSKPAPADGNALATATIYEHTLVESINAETVSKLISNIHYADNKQNLTLQIFPEPPEVWVTNPDGEKDDALTAKEVETFKRVKGYAAMQIAISDILDFGASVKSPGVERINGEYTITEIRNLPAKSFSLYVTGRAVNPIMQGITVEGEDVLVHQYDPTTGATERITNFLIVKQAETPEPAGRPYALPIYPALAEITFANKAAIQQVNRIGAPMFLPKAIDTVSPEEYDALIKWHKDVAKTWGNQTSNLIPPGVEFPNIQIREGTTAKDFINERIKWIQSFFNPTTDLDTTGASLGTSDTGRMEIWANYISSWQSLAEEWLENLFDQCHAYNGREGYHTHIRLKRPSIDRAAIRLQYMQALVAAKAITVEEIRTNAGDLLELTETTPELVLQLKEQYPAQSIQSLFANTKGFTRPEDRIMTETEEKLGAANNASLDAILRIMGYGGKE